MTDREKLVELVKDICNTVVKSCGCSDMLPTYSFNKKAVYNKIADHLLANGVTVQRWRDAKTDPPPIGKDVLLRFANETMVVGGLREDGGWYVIVDAEWYTDCEAVPEKWQPLPEVSKEEPK